MDDNALITICFLISLNLKIFFFKFNVEFFLSTFSWNIRDSKPNESKIWYSNNLLKSLGSWKSSEPEETFLLPSSDILKDIIPNQLEEASINYKRAIIYRTVVSDLSDLENVTYDCLVFYSPAGIESLYKDFPGFEQNNTKIAVFGETTKKAAEKQGLKVDIGAPAPNAPSMTGAIGLYIKANS